MTRRPATIAFFTVLALGLASRSSEAQSARPANAAPALQAVLADAAIRAGVAPASLLVLRMAAAEWPDSGLGCPQPGRLYMQMITPGWLLEVRAGGRTLEYHTDSGDHFALCAER